MLSFKRQMIYFHNGCKLPLQITHLKDLVFKIFTGKIKEFLDKSRSTTCYIQYLFNSLMISACNALLNESSMQKKGVADVRNIKM